MEPRYGFPLHGEALGDRIDAATLPPFRNYARCPQCQRGPGVWAFYCPTCRRIGGTHFHRECACGATWDERGVDPHGHLPMRGDGVPLPGE